MYSCFFSSSLANVSSLIGTDEQADIESRDKIVNNNKSAVFGVFILYKTIY